jgi:glycosyltransferase A (GT-A) superfamily protein (DUF2064 family)
MLLTARRLLLLGVCVEGKSKEPKKQTTKCIPDIGQDTNGCLHTYILYRAVRSAQCTVHSTPLAETFDGGNVNALVHRVGETYRGVSRANQ